MVRIALIVLTALSLASCSAEPEPSRVGTPNATVAADHDARLAGLEARVEALEAERLP